MEELIAECIAKNTDVLFGVTSIDDRLIQFQQTSKDFEGDITLVTFPFLKILKARPEEVGAKIGGFLKEHIPVIKDYNVVKGFLNLVIDETHWLNELNSIDKSVRFGFESKDSKPLKMVEFSSPNTNKPLHLGHLRNIFLGDAVANILQANGNKVIRTQIINNRGVHICKSMLAWQRFSPINANNERETPENTGIKGDKLAGKYYVEFDKHLNAEAKELMALWQTGNFNGFSDKVKTAYHQLSKVLEEKSGDDKTVKDIEGKIKELAKNQTELMKSAKEMLVRWEAKDSEIYELWKMMNGWVYKGFDTTYKTMHVSFDKLYYESDTYLLGKEAVHEGLQKGIFIQKEDGSVWCDLTADGLDEKLLLRADGTSVYMTQDIGTAIERYKDYSSLDGIIYTVANEQDYHFKVLFLILQKLGYSWADKCYHLSYGMVDLPTGKMKSREGTVVDADDLMAEMIQEAKSLTAERGQLDGLSKVDIQTLNHTIGIGALKYYLLKVDPKKRMLFNPSESVELNGNTAPFIQYGYARIQSLMRKVKEENITLGKAQLIEQQDVELIKQLLQFRTVIAEAAKSYSPALIANYCFELTKAFNSYYQNNNFMKETNADLKQTRLLLCKNIGNVLASGLMLLGIDVPERM